MVLVKAMNLQSIQAFFFLGLFLCFGFVLSLFYTQGLKPGITRHMEFVPFHFGTRLCLPPTLLRYPPPFFVSSSSKC